MLTVHLRVNDAATGTPTPVRLRVTDPAGRTYFPFGSHHEFPLGRNEDVGGRVRVGGDPWVYIDGACEIRLPAGVPLRVRATKGPEYTPLDATVTLGPGQMALRFAVERWTNLRADGWLSGDTRVHFLPPHAALLEAAAEDVAVVNLLARETDVPGQDGHLYPTAPHLTAFSGQTAAVASGASLVAVNTLNAHPVLGSVGLLHSHRVVFPLMFGGRDYPDDWSVCDWCDQCHRKRGLAVWAEPFAAAKELPPGGEALVALVLGKIDAVEFNGRSPLLSMYYLLLDAGFPVPVVGGSGKDSNGTVLGGMRTYAKLGDGEPPTYTNWVEAVRAGRSLATNGPRLRFTAEPGRLRAEAASLAPFAKVELVADGKVLASAPAAPDGGRWSASIESALNPAETTWVAARVVSTGADAAFAHTSPVVLTVNGAPLPRRAKAAAKLAAFVGQTREWVETVGHFTDEKWKRHLLERCDEALAKLAGAGP